MTRRFSTADLETLTKDTTPAPWRWHGSEDPDMRFIHSEDGNLCLAVDDSGSTYMPADPLLAAAAPDLAAELLCMRRAIEERIQSLRIPLCSHMPEGDELDEFVEQWERQNEEVRILTRILNGETNE